MNYSSADFQDKHTPHFYSRQTRRFQTYEL